MVDGVFGQVGAHVQCHVMVDSREELEHVQTQHRLVGEPPVWEKMYSSNHATNNHVKVENKWLSSYYNLLNIWSCLYTKALGEDSWH